MATKRKSIIEDALLEAKTLEDALKANTKEILASHMKEEIETIVESSLKEQGEELKIDADLEGSDEEPIEDAASEEEEVVDDLDITALDLGDEVGDEESELDVIDLDADVDGAELGIDILADLGADDIDLTGASDEEVVKVFKAMGDDDEVEVVKDEDGIYLSDAETGAEYYIKESEELSEDELCEGCGKDHVDEDDDVVYEIELDEHDGAMLGDEREGDIDYPHDRSSRHRRGHGESGGDQGKGRLAYLTKAGHHNYGGGADDYKLRGHHRAGDIGGGKYGIGGHYKNLAEDGMYKDEQGGEDYPNFKDTDPGYDGTHGSSHGEQGGKDFGRKGRNQKTRNEEEHLEEDKTQNNAQSGPYGGGRQRYGGQKAGTSFANSAVRGESRKPRKSISNKRKSPRNIENVSNSKIVKEYKELKTKNEEYKEALKLFKGKLNEVALFNTNLAYVNRLFTEHSTTKTEKMNILKRFDNAASVKESKNIYKIIKSELDEKTPLTESVENKVNRTSKSSASDLNESTAYVDPQIAAIKDLMKRIS